MVRNNRKFCRPYVNAKQTSEERREKYKRARAAGFNWKFAQQVRDYDWRNFEEALKYSKPSM